MSLLLAGVCFGLFILFLFLTLRLLAMQKLLSRMQEEQALLSSYWDAEKADISGMLGANPRPVVTIEILNAVEVAAEGSKIGRIVGKYAPITMRNQVYRHMAKNLREQMTGHGMQVEVNVHGLD